MEHVCHALWAQDSQHGCGPSLGTRGSNHRDRDRTVTFLCVPFVVFRFLKSSHALPVSKGPFLLGPTQEPQTGVSGLGEPPKPWHGGQARLASEHFLCRGSRSLPSLEEVALPTTRCVAQWDGDGEGGGEGRAG